MIVRHILGKSDKIRYEILTHLSQCRQVILRQIGIDALHQVRIVVEGIQVALNAEQSARIPERSLKSEPEYRMPLLLFGSPLPQYVGIELRQTVQSGQDPFVVVLILNNGPAVAFWRRGLLTPRPEPQLAHAIQAEVLLQIRIVRYSLFNPILTRQLPPTRPFNDGKALAHVTMDHHGLKAFSGSVQTVFTPLSPVKGGMKSEPGPGFRRRETT